MPGRGVQQQQLQRCILKITKLLGLRPSVYRLGRLADTAKRELP